VDEILHPLDPYLRANKLPHIWCPGCGIGIFLGQLIRALKELGVDWNRIVIISGIGCAGRISTYINCDTAHVIHGRAVPFAEGVKLAKPYLKVIVVGGDGDILSIGGNHFIHASHRRTPISVIMLNNMIYGMTGGQMAPTTPHKALTTTTPRGNPYEPLNSVAIAYAAGAEFIARWSVAHPIQLKNSLKKMFSKEVFGFLEVISPCPEIFGRLNRLRDPVDLLKTIKEICIIKNNINPMDATIDWPNKIVCGDFKVPGEPV